MLEWGVIQARNGSRLNPNGKYRIMDVSDWIACLNFPSFGTNSHVTVLAIGTLHNRSELYISNLPVIAIS
jgi:hypothetical protein